MIYGHHSPSIIYGCILVPRLSCGVKRAYNHCIRMHRSYHENYGMYKPEITVKLPYIQMARKQGRLTASFQNGPDATR